MMIRFIMILAVAFGVSQCKTNRVKEPQDYHGSGQNPRIASGEDLKKNFDFEVDKYLLTVGPAVENPKQLRLVKLEASTYNVGAQTQLVIGLEPDKSNKDMLADFAEYRICQENRCFAQGKTAVWAEEIVVPSSIQGSLKVFARACVIPKRVKVMSNELAYNCGPEEEKYVKINRANPSDATQKLLERRQELIAQMRAIVDRLLPQANSYVRWYESQEAHSEQEQVLYAVARNIETYPILMANIYSSRLSEDMLDLTKQAELPGQSSGDEGLNLAGNNREEVVGIRDSLSCRAAGGEWVNAERKCYREKKDDGTRTLKIDKEWFKGETQAGLAILAATVVTGAVWMGFEYAEYAKIRDVQEGWVKAERDINDLPSQGYDQRYGRSAKFLDANALDDSITPLRSMGLAGLLGGAILGATLLGVGLNLTGGDAHDFYQGLVDAQEVLKKLKQEFYAIEDKLFSSSM